MCFESVSKDFTNDEMNEISLKITVYGVLTNYGLIGTRNILNMHKYLMKKHNIK